MKVCTFDNRNRLEAIDYLPGHTGYAYTSPFDYSGESVAYTYDDRNQLDTADYAGTAGVEEDYAYDANGNRIGAQVIDGNSAGYNTTAGNDNRLEADGTYAYEYDNEGNRLTRTLKSGTSDEYLTQYQWDHRNRLVEVTFKNNSLAVTKTVTHTYDAANHWISRTVDTDGDGNPDERTVYVHDGGQIVLELEGDVALATDELTKDDLSHRYLWGPGRNQLLADEAIASLTDASQNDMLYALTDHLGTVRDLVDENLPRP